MADNRAPRSQDDRSNTSRKSDAWVPPAILPVPRAQDGWVFRWIRTSTLNKSDNTNVSQKFREGWIPVKLEDYPELQAQSDINSQFVGNVEIGGLLLCKAPAETMEKRQQYYENLANQQMEAVDTGFMQENDPRMPLLQPERKSRTSFGRGS